MTEKEYVSAIATLISSYRVRELSKPLDDAHVSRWLSQFDKGVRYVIVKEMFHILARNYIKEERIKTFLSLVLEHIKEYGDIEKVVFTNLQEKGKSQDIFCSLIKSIYEAKYDGRCRIIDNEAEIKLYSVYAYIDDGLYTGGRAKEDVIPLIRKLPEGSTLYVFYMVAYNNALKYYRDKINREAHQRNITVIIEVGQEKNNVRNSESDNIDFIWPQMDSTYNGLINRYQRRLEQTGRANYIYDWQSSKRRKEGLFSDYDSRVIVEKVFLEEGIKIANKINTAIFRPLGITNTPSFGFGSIYVTDYNISNTCPLVLWWGNLEGNKESSDAIGCWYPLFPRRTNQMTYNEICEYEDQFSLQKHRDVLWTVYRLAQKEKTFWNQSGNSNGIIESVIDFSDIDLDEIVTSRKRSDLLQYMHSLDLNTIKVIQTVMYIGRDYELPSYTDDEWEIICERMAEDPDYRIPEKKITVDNPDEVLLAWMDYLEMSKGGWNDKDIEIDQIYQKGPLVRYLKRAFDILGL